MKNNMRLSFKLSHTSYSIIFTTLLYVISNALNMDKIVKWFHLGNGIDYAALIAYLLFGLCVFIIFFMLLAHRWIIKPLSIILIISSAAATYFIAKYNVAIDRTMIMNLVYTDSSEVSSLLSVQMLPYVLFLMVLPIYLVLKVEITFERPAKYLFSSLKIILLSFVIGASAVYAEFDSIHRAANLSRKYIVHSLVPVNVIRSSISAISHTIEPYFKRHKKPVEFTARVTSPDDLVVVLAIGETSRQKSFSLYGYEKNTNPALSKYKDLHLLNGIASIGTTLYALPEILEKNGVKLPAVTSKAGVDTACYVNYSLYDNCTVPGEVVAKDCGHNGSCYDEDVVPLLAKSLKSYQSGYKFVVLHMGGGSHGPTYSDRYPPEFQKFQPMCFEADVVNQCTPEQLYNSYDNTILYVDYVLDKVIRTLDKSGVPYVLIYLSDHGESLLEEGRVFHGMPPGIPLPPEQAQIPLIVKSSVPISIIKKAEYKQQDVFDTVLDLFSIDSNIDDKKDSFIKKSDNSSATIAKDKTGKGNNKN